MWTRLSALACCLAAAGLAAHAGGAGEAAGPQQQGARTHFSIGQVSPVEEGFTPLFNGRDFSGFQFAVTPPSVWQVQNGVIVCAGRPNGYLYTEQSYSNYLLRFDWRYARPPGLESDEQFRGNSGVLMHIQGEHRVWPRCIEVQLMNRDAGNLLNVSGGTIERFHTDRRREAIKPVGEWNSMEVLSQNGRVVVTINGIIMSLGVNANLTEGPIGWQSEGVEIHFRNLRILELE